MALLSRAFQSVCHLSPTTKQDDAARQHFNLQTQSHFFGRLPAEIRQQIYQLALQVDSVIGLLTAARSDEIRLIASKKPQYQSMAGDLRLQSPLSFVLTCRRAHDEALPILYSINMFMVLTPVALKLLARSRGGSWLRSLRFGWTLNEPPPLRGQEGRLVRTQHSVPYILSAEEWDSAWTALADLSHLKQLHVEIIALDRRMDEWSSRERDLLRPLQGIISPGTSARLGLTWPPENGPGHEGVEETLDGWTITRHYHVGPFFISIGPTVGGRSQD